MKIIHQLHVTGFYIMSEDENKVAYTAGEDMLFAIFYLDVSEKYRFSGLNKRINNDYIVNKA